MLTLQAGVSGMGITIDLTGQSALVTGASQGIGAEIARTLHRAGARVMINHPASADGKTHADALAIVDELCRERGQSAVEAIANVADPAAVSDMMHRIRDDWGGIDILVNNAGILRDRSVARMSLEEWNSVLTVNLSGAFHCCKYGLEILRDGGSIVCLGSLAAETGFHGQANYAASKAGIHAMVRVLAGECARRSIRVNAVAPGLIDTPILAHLDNTMRSRLVKSIALDRLGRPSEVASAVLFLCSPLAGYITGHILAVDGGYHG